MFRYFFYIFLLLYLLGCSAVFVKKDIVSMLNEKYNAIYTTKVSISIGKNQLLSPGKKIRIYFRSTSDFIAVYAYDVNINREKVFGKNILILIKSDFGKQVFTEKIIKQELQKILRGLE